MRKHLIALLFLFPFMAVAQSPAPPRLTKTPIGNCGCSAYMPADMPKFNLSLSEDGAEVYTAELETSGLFYGCIAVKFAERFGDDYTSEHLEALLISYMDYLKSILGVTSSTGYGKGHTLTDYPDALGVLDYWQTGDSVHYAVKGWINRDKMGVLFLGKKDSDADVNVQNVYLNGWRFE